MKEKFDDLWDDLIFLWHDLINMLLDTVFLWPALLGAVLVGILLGTLIGK